MDIIILSTSLPHQETFWQMRVKEITGTIIPSESTVIVVSENQIDGLGNGLGTLSAYSKAQEKAKFMYHKDLFAMQQEGASVSLFQLAGPLPRLFPIIASEKNALSHLRLPIFRNKVPMNFLELIMQHAFKLMPPVPQGLSVFWGNQLITPATLPEPVSHIEVLTKHIPMPTEEEWTLQNLHREKVLGYDPAGNPLFLGKVTYENITDLIEQKVIESKVLGICLGSFRLSPQMTFALLREFHEEINNRNLRMDCVHHFWMPLTLELKVYQRLMKTQGMTAQQAQAHHERLAAFKHRFLELHQGVPFIGTCDTGPLTSYWKFGSNQEYYENLLKLISPTREGQAMRLFFQLPSVDSYNSSCRVIKDNHSLLIDCNVRSGKIVNSLLIGVQATSLECENCVIIESNFSKIHATDALLYRVQATTDLRLSAGTIRSDVSFPKNNQPVKLYSHLHRNSKEDWKVTLPQNRTSFESVYRGFCTK